MNRQPSPALLLILVVSVAVCSAPLRAEQDPGFGGPAVRDLVVPEFADREVSALIATLDSALLGQQPPPTPEEASYTLWRFVGRLQTGRLTPSQEAAVLDHFHDLGRAHADFRIPLERSGFMVRSLTVGKTAPDAVGQDLHGATFRLREYRGKVVVLSFSAEWCGICRSQYPYYRLMQDLYANWPFAILGVEAGERESIGRLKAQHGLNYRSWWDAPGAEGSEGPLASEWNVLGWPTTYVLDASGVVRFVNLRDEDLLRAVRQLLTDQVDRPQPAAPRQRH
jgi:peroxiredoxin